MKKNILIFLLSLIAPSIFTQTPDQLAGIWKGADRYIFFGKENQVAVILKEYYGWYYDRAAEPKDFSAEKKRARNSATPKSTLHFTSNFMPFPDNANLYEMEIRADEKTKSKYPIALIDDKIYLDFLVRIPYEIHQEEDKTTEIKMSENDVLGYWQGLNTADSIRLSPRNSRENIISWYFTENGVYRLRFWLTDMKFEDSKATFSDGNILYTINKHIFSAENNFTCVNGRSSNIRNVEKYQKFPFEYEITSDGSIMALGSPYLTKIQGKTDVEELLKIVEEANSRRKPDPQPLFPEENLDWHWDLINQLEAGNKIIQAVRERQRTFGPRHQDILQKK